MRLVDADAILNTFCDNCPNRAYCEDREQKCSAYSDTEETLKSAPTVENKFIKRGRWVKSDTQRHVEITYKCSECQHEVVGEYEKTPFCGECGARMDGDSE